MTLFLAALPRLQKDAPFTSPRRRDTNNRHRYMSLSHGGKNGTGYQTGEELTREKNNSEGLIEFICKYMYFTSSILEAWKWFSLQETPVRNIPDLCSLT